jgi:anti-anti-sigma factor
MTRLADLEVSNDGRVVVARIVGEVDMSNSEELTGALTAATPADAVGMVLDLSRVDYLDSAGIRLLYRLAEVLQARRQELTVVIPSASIITDVLRLAGVSDYVGAVETVDEALALIVAH